MICSGCGFTVPAPKTSDRRCVICGVALRFDTDDFLLHRTNGLIEKVRPGQVTMGRLVETAIAKKQYALIEGSVGLGKSFAYSIPSLLSGARTVISTAKKALQHQLAGKDIPRLAVYLEKHDLKIGVVKGKSNYACRVKVDSGVPDEEKPAFLNWLDKSKTGDISDYPGQKPRYWGDVSAEDCLGCVCKYARRNECAYWTGRRQAMTAPIVIANHHVVAFDLRFGPYKMLGPYDTLVIDEAHQAEGAFRGAYAQSLYPGGFRRIVRAMDKAGMPNGNLLEAAWTDMFKNVANMDGEIAANPFEALGDTTLAVLDDVLKDIKSEIGGSASDPDAASDDDDMSQAVGIDNHKVAALEMLRRTIYRSRTALAAAKEPDQNTVLYITTGMDKRMKIVNVAPVDVGALVAPKFAALKTVVVTSATIAVNGGFDYIRRRLGLNPWPSTDPNAPTREVVEAILESPFDYTKQALLYTPKHLPLPVSGNFDEGARRTYLNSITLEIARLIKAARGNAFVLFSATADLVDVHQRLLEEDLGGVTLVPQGDDAEGALRRFHATPNSAILGIKSFWEGVDVVGDKLRLVIIPKLPFPMVSDPIIQAQARRIKATAVERGQDERTAETQVFQTLQIPLMLTDLRQGAGRLIRSTTDRGVLAILDSRVWTGSSRQAPNPAQQSYRGYGAAVVAATSFAQKTSDFGLVQGFLNMIERQSTLGKKVA